MLQGPRSNHQIVQSHVRLGTFSAKLKDRSALFRPVTVKESV